MAVNPWDVYEGTMPEGGVAGSQPKQSNQEHELAIKTLSMQKARPETSDEDNARQNLSLRFEQLHGRPATPYDIDNVIKPYGSAQSAVNTMLKDYGVQPLSPVKKTMTVKPEVSGWNWKDPFKLATATTAQTAWNQGAGLLQMTSENVRNRAWMLPPPYNAIFASMSQELRTKQSEYMMAKASEMVAQGKYAKSYWEQGVTEDVKNSFAGQVASGVGQVPFIAFMAVPPVALAGTIGQYYQEGMEDSGGDHDVALGYTALFAPLGFAVDKFTAGAGGKLAKQVVAGTAGKQIVKQAGLVVIDSQVSGLGEFVTETAESAYLQNATTGYIDWEQARTEGLLAYIIGTGTAATVGSARVFDAKRTVKQLQDLGIKEDVAASLTDDIVNGTDAQRAVALKQVDTHILKIVGQNDDALGAEFSEFKSSDTAPEATPFNTVLTKDGAQDYASMPDFKETILATIEPSEQRDLFIDAIYGTDEVKEQARQKFNQNLVGAEPVIDTESKEGEQAPPTPEQQEEQRQAIAQELKTETRTINEFLDKVGISRASREDFRRQIGQSPAEEVLPMLKSWATSVRNAKESGVKVEDLLSLSQKLITTPTAANDEDFAKLLVGHADMVSQIKELQKQHTQAIVSGNEQLARELEAKMSSLYQIDSQILTASEKAGTKAGRALRMLAAKISLDTMDIVSVKSEAVRLNRGQPLSPEVDKQLEDSVATLQEQKALIDAQQEAMDVEEEIYAVEPLPKDKVDWITEAFEQDKVDEAEVSATKKRIAKKQKEVDAFFKKVAKEYGITEDEARKAFEAQSDVQEEAPQQETVVEPTVEPDQPTEKTTVPEDGSYDAMVSAATKVIPTKGKTLLLRTQSNGKPYVKPKKVMVDQDMQDGIVRISREGANGQIFSEIVDISRLSETPQTIGLRMRSERLKGLSAEQKKKVVADAKKFNSILHKSPLFTTNEDVQRIESEPTEKNRSIALSKHLQSAREKVALMLGDKSADYDSPVWMSENLAKLESLEAEVSEIPTSDEKTLQSIKRDEPETYPAEDLPDNALIWKSNRNGQYEWMLVTKSEETTQLADGEIEKLDRYDAIDLAGMIAPDEDGYDAAMQEFKAQRADEVANVETLINEQQALDEQRGQEFQNEKKPKQTLEEWQKANGITPKQETEEMFGKGAVGDVFKLSQQVAVAKESFSDKQKREAKADALEKAQTSFFTQEEKAELDKLSENARKRGSQMSSGIDPTILLDAIKATRIIVKAGVRNFIDFSKRMVQQFGESIRPHLRKLWNDAKADTEIDEAIRNEMDDAPPEVKFTPQLIAEYKSKIKPILEKIEADKSALKSDKPKITQSKAQTSEEAKKQRLIDKTNAIKELIRKQEVKLPQERSVKELNDLEKEYRKTLLEYKNEPWFKEAILKHREQRMEAKRVEREAKSKQSTTEQIDKLRNEIETATRDIESNRQAQERAEKKKNNSEELDALKAEERALKQVRKQQDDIFEWLRILNEKDWQDKTPTAKDDPEGYIAMLKNIRSMVHNHPEYIAWKNGNMKDTKRILEIRRLEETFNNLERQYVGKYRDLKKDAYRDTDMERQQWKDDISLLKKKINLFDRIADAEESINLIAAGRAEEVVKKFAKKEKPQSKEDAELAKMKVELARKENEVLRILDSLRDKTALDYAFLTADFFRSVALAGDIAASGRQGGKALLSSPITSIRAFQRSLQTLFSERNFRKNAEDLQKKPLYDPMVQWGLALTTIDAAFDQNQEAMNSKLAEKFPWVKPSSRQMISVLNELRYGLMENFVKQHPDLPDSIYVQYAKFVNEYTGRGGLGKAESHAKLLARFFLAPRWVASNLQSPFSIRHAFDVDSLGKRKFSPEIAKAIGKEWAAYWLFWSSMAALFTAIGFSVSTDPEDPDFMRFRKDNISIDLTGGYAGTLKLFSLFAETALASAVGVGELEEGEGLLRAAQNYVTYKTSPLITMPFELARGKNIVGQEREWYETIVGAALPIIAQQVYYNNKEGFDLQEIATAIALEELGVGVRLYAEEKPVSEMSPIERATYQRNKQLKALREQQKKR